MKAILVALLLIYSTSVFGSKETLETSVEDLSNKQTSVKRPLSPQASEEETENKKLEPKEKKSRIKDSIRPEEKLEEEEPTEEEQIIEPAIISSEIGQWVGDLKEGIKGLRLHYGEIDLKHIVEWHISAGQEMSRIGEIQAATDKTNIIRARIDFIYREQDRWGTRGTVIPALFISGHSAKGAKQSVINLEKDIQESHITSDPCISIDAYFAWKDLGKDNFEEIRREFISLFEEGAEHFISEKLLEQKKQSLETSTKGGFQWIHSEEPLVLYLWMKTPQLALEEKTLPSFEELLTEMKIPAKSFISTCILSIVSNNDCCTNCRPLTLEAIENKSVLHHSLEKSLGNKHKMEENLEKFILYSALKEFTIKRPINSDDFLADINLATSSYPFLMAKNVRD